MTPKQIKQIRLSLGYTLDEWAHALGYSHKQRAATVWRWEKGTPPPPPAIILMKQMAK